MRPVWAWTRRPLRRLEPVREDGSAGGPCLVHLVRKVEGTGPLREFGQALRAHPPGTEYELVLAMKGFSSPQDALPHLRAVADLEPRVMFFPDRRFDLGVYFAAAARLRRDRYCFVNSNGRPLVDGWLAKLDAALSGPGVGQVGVTGSWASQHSWLTYSMGLPSAYRELMPPVQVARRLLLDVELDRYGKARRSLSESARARLRTLVRVPEELLAFDAFPTPHLRPNTFMISHAALSELCLFVVMSKMDTLALESGRRSITSQLRRLGLTSLVVDRDGAVYRPERWHRSRTLWQGQQEGLLVADNQTRHYADGDDARREILSTFAWGAAADPQPRLSPRRPRS
jgi:hypothetical protein